MDHGNKRTNSPMKLIKNFIVFFLKTINAIISHCEYYLNCIKSTSTYFVTTSTQILMAMRRKIHYFAMHFLHLKFVLFSQWVSSTFFAIFTFHFLHGLSVESNWKIIILCAAMKWDLIEKNLVISFKPASP